MSLILGPSSEKEMGQIGEVERARIRGVNT